MSGVICSKQGANPTPLIAPAAAFFLSMLHHCFVSLNVVSGRTIKAQLIMPQCGGIRLCGLLQPFQSLSRP